VVALAGPQGHSIKFQMPAAEDGTEGENVILFDTVGQAGNWVDGAVFCEMVRRL
jgi:hypothetical protein